MDTTYEQVEAQLRRLSPENLDIVAQFITTLTTSDHPIQQNQEATNGASNGDPWAGFYGAFEASVPDLIERHDYYIGLEAMDPHEENGDNADDAAVS